MIHAKRASELLGAGGQRVADLLSTLSDGHPPRAGALVGELAS